MKNKTKQRDARETEGMLFRTTSIIRAEENQDDEKRTIELAFSSEEPVNRGFEIEILDHGVGAVNMDRLLHAAPLLVNHDPRQHVGVVESARIDKDRVGRAVVRFGDSPEADQIFKDVKNGIRALVSVGYRIEKTETTSNDNGPETVRATSWTPYELSLASVPADYSVGVGRSIEPIKDTKIMPEIAIQTAPNPAQAENSEELKRARTKEIDDLKTKALEQGRTDEKKRCSEITTLAGQYGVDPKDAARFMAEGKTREDFQQHILETKFNAKPVDQNTPAIGMNDREISRYSLTRAMSRLANGQPLDGLEKEASDTVSKRIGKEPSGFFIPWDVQARAVSPQQRALNVTTDTAGGFTVGTDVLFGSMVELLRNKSLIASLGAKMLSGLTGNVAIPKHTGGSTASWLDETATVSNAQQTFGQLGLVPRRLVVSTAFTKQLLAQSSLDIEGFVRNDITQVLAIAKDLACIDGIGGVQPVGIMRTTGRNTLTFGGAATWADMVNFEEAIATDNADVSAMHFLTTPASRAKWKTIERASNTAKFLWADDQTINGYPGHVTNQVPTNRVIFGNFADVVIAEWDGVDVVVDPYSLATSNQVRITITIMSDVGVRNAVSFCVSTDSGAQ